MIGTFVFPCRMTIPFCLLVLAFFSSSFFPFLDITCAFFVFRREQNLLYVKDVRLFYNLMRACVEGKNISVPFTQPSTFFTATACSTRERERERRKNIFIFVSAALLLKLVLQMSFDKEIDKTIKSSWPTIFHH